jgi:hypothetical protein
MEGPMKKTKIPNTDSIKELAHFFETHELADFEDELVEVKEPVFVRRTGIRIHLEPYELKAVKQLAQDEGVSQEALLRGWVLERLAPKNGKAKNKRLLAGKRK